MFGDLREFIDRVNEVDDLRLIEGADWDLEIGVLTELLCPTAGSPLLLFDNIKGYPPGYRVATNLLSTEKRFALAMGLPLEAKGLDLVNAWRRKMKVDIKPIPPVEVRTGPVQENVHTGDDIDVFEFPTPKWHELDGGRYIGTGDLVVLKDPDGGWVNLGTYRVQIFEKSVATIYMDPGRHGDVIRKKYWERGLSCPAAIVCGQEPLVWTAANTPVAQGISEYDYAGGMRGEPVQVIKGPITGLPVPATAEIVLEGEMVPPSAETRLEGPFGEWSGYYASGGRPEPAFRIKSILHRNDPIITGAAPLAIPADPFKWGKNIVRSAQVWDELDTKVPGVKGVWAVGEAAGRHMIVVSIEQKYGGHAKHAAMAVASCYTTAQINRFVIIVDDDIDPSNMNEVVWALGTRCDPESSIDIISQCYGTPLDTMLSPEKRSRRDYTHSKAFIMACKPYYWMKEFPIPISSKRELKERVKQKWRHLF